MVVLLAAAGAAVALAWTTPLPTIARPAPESLDRTLVASGEALSHLGNCRSCHTAAQGKPFAGGHALETPFGTIFATNITPDPETGIGTWPLEAFARAMRLGIARNGDHLYPAFPYDHFTHASDGDLAALYAFLMAQPAVNATTPTNRLRPPFDWRRLVTAWNLIYLHPGALPADAAKSADWNRGRELAEGLAHCGGCHTPRNDWGAEIAEQRYDGAWIRSWYAPPLNAQSPAARPWTEDELFSYLRTGLASRHSAAAGPMADVTRELAQAKQEDVRALAVYFADLMSGAANRNDRPPIDKPDADTSHAEGAVLFAGACATCHAPGAPMMQQGRPALSFATSLNVAAPNDALHVMIHGLSPTAGRAGPSMPAFGEIFSDSQIAEIAAYMRARFTDRPAWSDVARAVSDVRGAAAHD
jgi:mono/diheme cytochrome c family protein